MQEKNLNRIALPVLAGLIAISVIFISFRYRKSEQNPNNDRNKNIPVTSNTNDSFHGDIATNTNTDIFKPLFPVNCQGTAAELPTAPSGWKYISRTDACLFVAVPDVPAASGVGFTLGNDPEVFGDHNYLVVFEGSGGNAPGVNAYILPLEANESPLPGIGKTFAEVRTIGKNVGTEKVALYALPVTDASGSKVITEPKYKTQFFVMDAAALKRIYVFEAFYVGPLADKSDGAEMIRTMIAKSIPF